MKQVDMKKTLLMLLVLCGVLVVFFFWNQSPGPPNPYSAYFHGSVPFHKELGQFSGKEREDPVWTWACVNQRCEKREIDVGIRAASLSTCGMLCGSTQLWPQPTGPVTLGTHAVAFLHKQLDFRTNAAQPALGLLRQAYAIFSENVVEGSSSGGNNSKSDVKRFTINVTLAQSDVTKLRLDTDEGYKLTVRLHEDALMATVEAANFFGARHGLETLAQLVWWDECAHRTSGSLMVLKAASVQDRPSFAYRGLLVDTARNFMTVGSIKKVLTGMAANKLNVFHWHVSDSQSFSLAIPSVPQLAKYGAYSTEMTYSREATAEIVDYARVRGIRVVIEVDTPAHAGNGWTWGPQEGLGELAVCVNARPWTLYCGEPPCGQLNPENPHVFGILEKIYRDILQMTGEDEIFHVGGDEVNLECWSQFLPPRSSSASFFNYTDLHDLWGDFTLKALERVATANGGRLPKCVVVWSSNLSKRPYAGRYLDKETVVVQSWGASQWPDTAELLADGYKVIVSHVDAWYLDCGFGRWRETGEAACDPYRPWQTMYNHRPWTPATKKQMVGGEACLWAEQLDEVSLDTRLWPRAAAFAERVWSDPPLNVESFVIAEDVYTRLSTQRERLVSRGLGAEAMWPAWCTQNPGMCL